MSVLNKKYSRHQTVFYLAGLLPIHRKEALAVIDAMRRAVEAIAPVRRRRKSHRRR